MASQFDDSDFVDREYQSSQAGYSAAKTGAAVAPGVKRPPSREELESRVSEAQQKLAELKRAQEELERERAALEDARRRRLEFQTGREEMLQNLTRGVTLLEQSEFTARRDAEQMAKTLGELREALLQIQAIQDESWTQENWNAELSKGLAIVENARLEWNSARLKWELLNGQGAGAVQKGEKAATANFCQGMTFLEICKLGFALTWPIAVLGLLGILVLLVRLR